jgi:imidazoleglycerol-phosphate dehydratase
MVAHVVQSFAVGARLTLHVRQLAGANDHHIAEAAFKALGRALDAATRLDERIAGQVPSTKETLTA